MREGPFLDDWFLHMHADVLDDFERVRCANENRLRSMTTVHGLNDMHPDVVTLADMVRRLQAFEHESALALQRRLRKHPLWQPFKDERGIGEKQFARLLAVVGDPAWHSQLDQPRTCRQLRAYCGMHVWGEGAKAIAPRRQRGVQSNWSEDARKRLWLIADSIIRANMGANSTRPDRSKYAKIYEEARYAQYGFAIHEQPCIRCGPKGSPAPTGSDLSDGHKKGRAMRKVGVEILNDLWREAYRLHNE